MMKALQIIPLIVLTVLMAVLALPAHGQTGIIINNADTVRQEGVSLDSGLSSTTGSVSARIVLQYANTKREERIAAPPADLEALFAQVSARIVLQYANTSRQVVLAYPVALIGDTVPPQISNVQAQNVAGGVKVTWTTDEFARSEVRFGTAPGAYTQTVADPLFEKTHALTLTGLTVGRTYYFLVRGADRSGNQAQSGEYQVKVQTKTYLPTILRGR